jgi:hypothetical protein
MALLVALGWLATCPAASAAEQVAQGWWTTSGALRVPAAVIAPDVPADGLLVEGGPSGPLAYAALAGTLPGDSALVLDVAPDSVTTADVPIQVCPLVSPSFTPAQGGSLEDAPAYDRARCAMVTPSSGRYRIEMAAVAPDGALAIALVPATATDRVVLAKPVFEAGFVVPGSAEPGPTDLPPSVTPSVTIVPSPVFDPVSTWTVPLPVAALPVAPKAAPRAPAPNLVPVGASLPEDADPVAVAITLVVGLAGTALWFGARHAARATVASGP